MSRVLSRGFLAGSWRPGVAEVFAGFINSKAPGFEDNKINYRVGFIWLDRTALSIRTLVQNCLASFALEPFSGA